MTFNNYLNSKYGTKTKKEYLKVFENKKGNKYYPIDKKSFIDFIKPFININNFIDYYKRNDNIKTYNVSEMMNKTFNNDIIKFNIDNITIEKMNKPYLFFKNDLNDINNVKVSFIKFDEFLLSFKIKPTFKFKKELESNFNIGKYSNQYYNKLFNSLIIIKETLLNDEKKVSLFLNKNCFYALNNTINKNYYIGLTKRDKKQLRSIRKKSYTFKELDKNDMLEKIAYLKNEREYYQQKIIFLQKMKEDKLRDKNVKNQINNLFNVLNPIMEELEELNNYLIDIDKKEDNYLSNIHENNNISLKLKDYIL